MESVEDVYSFNWVTSKEVHNERMEDSMVLFKLRRNIFVAMNSAGGVYYVIFGEPWTTSKVVICALIPVGLFVWYKMRGAE